MSYEPASCVDGRTDVLAEGVEMRVALRFCRGFVIAAALGVAGCHVPVSRATSPDGRWTLEVRSEPRLFGLFGSTVVARRKGPDGKWDDGHVIDMCDWSDAKKKYGTIDITNDRAVFGDRVERFGRPDVGREGSSDMADSDPRESGGAEG